MWSYTPKPLRAPTQHTLHRVHATVLIPDRNQERRRSLADQATAHCHKGTNTLMMCLCATAWAAEPRGERRNRDVYTRYATQDRPPYGGHSQTATRDDDDAAHLCRKRTRNRFAHHATYDADPIPRTNLIGLCPRPSPFTGAALSPCLSHIQQPITLRCGRQYTATGNTAHASPERYMRHPLT